METDPMNIKVHSSKCNGPLRGVHIPAMKGSIMKEAEFLNVEHAWLLAKYRYKQAERKGLSKAQLMPLGQALEKASKRLDRAIELSEGAYLGSEEIVIEEQLLNDDYTQG